MADKAKKNESIKKFQKEKCRCYSIRFSKVSEQKELDWMEEHRPCVSYIKGLIRKDMESKQ